MRSQLRERVRLLWCACAGLVLAALSLAVAVVTIVDLVLVAVWVGIPLLGKDIALMRWLAQLHRRHAGELLGIDVATPYLRDPTGNLLARTRALFADPATRRDLWWLWINGSVGLALAVLAVVEALLDLLLWWLPPGFALRWQAKLCVAMLQPAEKSRLALRVEQLTESRAATVDTSAAELRRIERDLHDGAQARLVALGMSLALAEEQVGSDPGRARELLGEARAASSLALAELRDLVRGIHPPVLADRGLVGAVQALALAAPLPVHVSADVPDRLPAPVESAAYLAVAEALTNVIKHSEARRASIALTRRGDVLDVQVRDDGRGGADASRGTGLRGIERRLAAFDGRLVLTSPPGGPTELTMELPCLPHSASSSPKTSPSSGTA